MDNRITRGEPPAQTEQLLENQKQLEALHRFLDTLKAEERAVFVLRYTAELSVPEIAARCGRSRAAVRLSLRRTESKLRRFLKKEGWL
jgi:RNA polymerase sigma factor (sigma-70 family)